MGSEMCIRDSHRTMPLPGLLHSAAEATSSSSAAPSIRPHDVRPGQWTLLACHERKDPPAFRYAFVTVDEENKIHPLSADDFFKETTSMWQLWRHAGRQAKVHLAKRRRRRSRCAVARRLRKRSRWSSRAGLRVTSTGCDIPALQTPRSKAESEIPAYFVVFLGHERPPA